jgi:hypothetical protein
VFPFKHTLCQVMCLWDGQLQNLHRCPKSCRLNAYTSFVRSTLEYGAVVWDPFLKSEVEQLDRIQRKAARFITGDYKSRDPGCFTIILNNLDLPTLQQRRKELRLAFLFKVVEGLVPPSSHADNIPYTARMLVYHTWKVVQFVTCLSHIGQSTVGVFIYRTER